MPEGTAISGLTTKLILMPQEAPSILSLSFQIIIITKKLPYSSYDGCSKMNSEHIIPQIILRSWPFPRGTGYLVKRFFEHLKFKGSSIIVKTTDGFLMRIMPNEHIGRYIYLTGEFDRSTFEVLNRYAAPGDVLIDIGANIGYMSACFLSNVEGSTVIAVEPQPQVVDLLTENLSQFDGRAQVARVAISDKTGESFMNVDEINRGASKLTAQPSSRSAKIQTWSAQQLIDTFKPDKIDIIKIDVEGHEEVVFASLHGIISQYRPRLIMFEDHTDKAAPTSSIGKMLSNLNYSIHGVKKNLTNLKFPEISSPSDCVYNDYVALLRDGG